MFLINKIINLSPKFFIRIVFQFNMKNAKKKLKMLLVTKIAFTNKQIRVFDMSIFYLDKIVLLFLLYRIFFLISDSPYTWNYHWHSIRISSHLSRTRTIGKGGRVWLLCLSSVWHVQPKVSNGSQVFQFPAFIRKRESNCELHVLMSTAVTKIIIKLLVLSVWLIELIIDK